VNKEEKRSRFITVEGIDGCGKTTISRFIFEWLESKGFDVIYTVEPTGTWVGDCVKRGFSELSSPFAEALLFMADRAEHSLQIGKWISEGKIVVSDRYVDSTFAYQGASLESEGLENAVKWLKEASVPYIFVPDLTLLLLLDPATSLERISSRPRKTKFENLDFLVEVDKVYRNLSESEERFRVVDASQSLDEVKENVIGILKSEI
jgi:dTMP kinase